MDLFVGLSGPGIIEPESLAKMNDDAIVFAMANPTPEVMPEDAAPYVRIMATGRSDYPNQINNVLAFPGIFRGALDAGAPSITEEMKLAAAQGIAMAVSEEDLAEDYIIPSVFNREVAPKVAEAVVEEAKRDGIARLNEETGTFATVDADAEAGTDPVKVLVTGASGLIGSALCDALLARGDDGRRPHPRPAARPRRQPERRLAPLGADPGTAAGGRLRGRRRVVNLVGEKINQRWTDEAKQRIMESRRTGTHNLVGTIAGLEQQARRCWSTSRRSATTATAATRIVDESAGPGDSFDAEVVQEWEKAAHEVEATGVRLVDRPHRPGARPRRRPAERAADPVQARGRRAARRRRPVPLLDPRRRRGRDPVLWALDNEQVSGTSTPPPRTRSTNQRVLEGARPRPRPPRGRPGPRLRPRPQIRRRVRQGAARRAAGDAAAGAGARLRVQAPGAGRGARGPALARPRRLFERCR